MQHYTDLELWKEARKLTSDVYKLTRSFPVSEQYGLTLQIRRAVVSICSNVAEGIGRSTKKDTTHFLYMSRGSLYELETQLYLSLDLEFIDEIEFNNINQQVVLVRKLLSGMINYFKSDH